VQCSYHQSTEGGPIHNLQPFYNGWIVPSKGYTSRVRSRRPASSARHIFSGSDIFIEQQSRQVEIILLCVYLRPVMGKSDLFLRFPNIWSRRY